MSRKKKRIGIVKSAGSRRAGLANSPKSFVIIDKCDKCPVRVYEDVVCNDNLQALVIEDAPSEDVLRMAKIDLITEFAELSGDKQSGKLSGHLRMIHLYRAYISGYTIAVYIIDMGNRPRAVEYLRNSGFPVKETWTDEELTKKIVSKVKYFDTRLHEELKKYEAALPKEMGDKMTADYFTAQLVGLSDDAGVHLTKDIMMSEFAIRIKNLQKKLEYVKRHTKH